MSQFYRFFGGKKRSVSEKRRDIFMLYKITDMAFAFSTLTIFLLAFLFLVSVNTMN